LVGTWPRALDLGAGNLRNTVFAESLGWTVTPIDVAGDNGNPSLGVQEEDTMDATEKTDFVRMSLKIPRAEYDLLRKYADDKNISITDGIRRAIGLLTFIEGLLDKHSLLLENKDTERIREVVFPW